MFASDVDLVIDVGDVDGVGDVDLCRWSCPKNNSPPLVFNEFDMIMFRHLPRRFRALLQHLNFQKCTCMLYMIWRSRGMAVFVDMFNQRNRNYCEIDWISVKCPFHSKFCCCSGNARAWLVCACLKKGSMEGIWRVARKHACAQNCCQCRIEYVKLHWHVSSFDAGTTIETKQSMSSSCSCFCFWTVELWYMMMIASRLMRNAERLRRSLWNGEWHSGLSSIPWSLCKNMWISSILNWLMKIWQPSMRGLCKPVSFK